MNETDNPNVYTATRAELVEILAPADVILSPAVPVESVRRWLWCELCAETKVHTLENDCFYVCTGCENPIRHVINTGKPMWAIR
jgi:hypothetical protein